MRTRGNGAARGGSFVDKIWLKEYPKGVPAEIDVNEYASVREVFEESVVKYGERPSYTCMGKTLTFDELNRLSAAFGSFSKTAAMARAAASCAAGSPAMP